MEKPNIDEKTIKIYQDIEIRNFDFYSVCREKLFSERFCDDFRVIGRNRIYFAANVANEIQKTVNAISFWLSGRSNQKAILVLLSYPEELEKEKSEVSLDFLNDNIICIDSRNIRLDMKDVENYAYYAGLSTYCDDHDLDGVKEYLEEAYRQLSDWIDKIRNAEVMIYEGNEEGRKIIVKDYFDVLLKEAQEKYYLSPETMDLNEHMYLSHSIREWVRCGFYELDDEYAQRIGDPLPGEVFSCVWHNDDDWYADENADEKIVQIKKECDRFIDQKLNEEGQIEFKEVFEHLKQPPYGLLSNVIGATICGMIMRSWANKGLSWSNGIHNDALDEEHLVSMIANALSDVKVLNRNRQPEYILRRIDELLPLFKASEKIFSLEQRKNWYAVDLRKAIREKLEMMEFPLWVLNYTEKDDDLKKAVDDYLDMARFISSREVKDESIERLNTLFRNNEDLVLKLKDSIENDMENGMKGFLEQNDLNLESYKKYRPDHDEWKWIWKQESLLEHLKGQQ